MRTVVRYVCHDGEEIRLNGPDAACSEGRMFDWEWVENEVNGRVASMHRKRANIELDVAMPESRAAVAMDSLARLSFKDAEAAKPGRLYVGDWYIEGYLSSSKKMGFWPGSPASAKLKLIADDPLWTREDTTLFRVPAPDDGNGIDYPHEWPHDYGNRVGVDYVSNRCGVPAPVKIIVYGPVTNPRVSIGGNVYGANVKLASGETLSIDGRSKTVVKASVSGSLENAFASRYGVQTKGGGSYAFEPVATGQSAVSWDGSFAFSVTIYERSQEPSQLVAG